MKVTAAIEWLKQNGYKYEKDDSENWTTHYLYKRTDASECQCNKRSPNIGWEIAEHCKGVSVSVKIRGKAVNGQWVNVGYYSMPIDEVKELESYEQIVSSMWECSNKKEKK